MICILKDENVSVFNKKLATSEEWSISLCQISVTNHIVNVKIFIIFKSLGLNILYPNILPVMHLACKSL